MELGAQTIVYQLETIAVVFPVGISIAGNVRVGNSLGAKNTEQAKLSAKSAMLCAVSVSICPATFFGALKDYIPYVFTNDEQIRKRVADLACLYIPFSIFEAITIVLGGIIRGTGKQKIGAICNILGFYGVGIPIGASLMFAAKLGITGLWIGLLTCIFLQTSFLTIYLSRLNWKKVTEEVSVKKKFRLFKKKKKGSPHPFKFKDNFKKLTFSPRLRSEWETHQAQVRKPEQQLIISCFSSEANS
uniref:Uncharacterized protein n=1 Tax=Tetraodon nigroviridis TaxID=99883 RepID=H3C0U7_TETNG